MIDFLADNIFIIVPVILILAVRMIGARIKQAKAKSSGEEEQPEFHEEEPAHTLGHWESEKPAAKVHTPPAHQAPVFTPKPDTSFFTRHDLEPSAVSKPVKTNIPATGMVKPVSAAEPFIVRTPVAKPTLFQNINKLPLYKKSIVMSEILSPPKALRRE